ncbi:unnamed protein product [Phytophthora fragariaefolia]|uniref:Unnamed protein product n=1 Tax=Phytophthora fragariaefolia TaxID=1490495 RepID=A0A9W6Y3C0_9STRA|nr:unnamed protein product [Phytophthora fragariaefolia]
MTLSCKGPNSRGLPASRSVFDTVAPILDYHNSASIHDGHHSDESPESGGSHDSVSDIDRNLPSNLSDNDDADYDVTINDIDFTIHETELQPPTFFSFSSLNPCPPPKDRRRLSP